MKMVEALIQTGKPYDLIVLPEEGHDPRTRPRGRFLLSEGFSSCELTGSLQGCQGRVGPDTLQVRLTPPGGPRGGVQVVSPAVTVWAWPTRATGASSNPRQSEAEFGTGSGY